MTDLVIRPLGAGEESLFEPAASSPSGSAVTADSDGAAGSPPSRSG